MNRTQLIVLIVVGLIMTGSVSYYMMNVRGAQTAVAPVTTDQTSPSNPSGDTARMDQGEGKKPPAQNPEHFSGKLESINTGCFSDGECFAMVSGKHVTAIWGWTNETVGLVKGVESFGDLDKHIGAQVDVYANKLDDGTYTLYGNTEYTIEVPAPAI